MIAYQVDDMTCDHCVATITQAVQAVDAHAGVTIDLARKLVMVEPDQAGAQQLTQAITDAGFTPAPVETSAAETPAAGAPSCCGHCH